MSTQYRIELGFDWNSSPITGDSITVQSTGNTLSVYPLQLALTNDSDKGSPAFFSGLKGGDQINFWIFDITSILGGTAAWGTTGYSFNGQSGFEAIFQQNGAGANPFTVPVLWEMVPQPGTSTSYAFSTSGQGYGFSPVIADFGGKDNNFATLANPHGGAVTFELSVKLTLSLNGVTKTFVTDPELIVDEGGG